MKGPKPQSWIVTLAFEGDDPDVVVVVDREARLREGIEETPRLQTVTAGRAIEMAGGHVRGGPDGIQKMHRCSDIRATLVDTLPLNRDR